MHILICPVSSFKNRASMASTTLPMDILSNEILSKLPAKTLTRFKSVCKSWKTLITSPEFISLHLRNSLFSKSDQLLIITIKNSLFSYNLQSQTPQKPKLLLPDTRNNRYYAIFHFVIGSCNGLLCFGAKINPRIGDPNSFVLMNPSTGIHIKVTLDDEPSWTNHDSSGFGFDPETGDYKIVRIIDHVKERHSCMFDVGYDDDYGVKCREVKVYSFKTGSWRLVEMTYPNRKDSMSYDHNGALIGTHLLHWKFWSHDEDDYRVRCFDLRTEQWVDNVALPDKYFVGREQNAYEDMGFSDGDWGDDVVDDFTDVYEYPSNGNLGVLDGCLCIFHKEHYSQGGAFEVSVWVMKEYGVKESWVRLLSFRDTISLPHIYDDSTIRVDAIYRDNRRSEVLLYPKSHVCTGSLVTIPGGGTENEAETQQSVH